MSNGIGRQLRHLRLASRLTQEKVAGVLNISREAYSLYEADKRQMNYDSLKKLSELYNVSTDFILGLSDSLNNYSLDSDEEGLIEAYRKSDERGKKIILEMSKYIGA